MGEGYTWGFDWMFRMSFATIRSAVIRIGCAGSASTYVTVPSSTRNRSILRGVISCSASCQPRSFTGTPSFASSRSCVRLRSTCGRSMRTSPTRCPESSARQCTLVVNRSTWRTGGSGCAFCPTTSPSRAIESEKSRKCSFGSRTSYPSRRSFIRRSMLRRNGSSTKNDATTTSNVNATQATNTRFARRSAGALLFTGERSSSTHVTQRKPHATRRQTEREPHAGVRSASPSRVKEKQEESRSWPLTHSEVLRLLASAARGWRDDNALRLGGALSFYSLVSFPPLIIVTISIAALIFGREAAQAGLLRQVAQLLGKSGSEMVAQMMKAARRPGHGLVAASIGLVFVLFGATGVFAELRDALNLIWKVQSTDKNVVRGLLKGRLLALNLVIGTGFLLIVSLIVSAALSALSASVGSHLKGFDQVLQVQGLDLVVSFGVLAL